jgi:hypothetical protein
MEAAAKHDVAIAGRVQHLLYRVPEELYDYGRDPDALTNLADDAAYGSVKARYRELLLEEMRTSGDPQLAGYEGFLTPGPRVKNAQ